MPLEASTTVGSYKICRTAVIGCLPSRRDSNERPPKHRNFDWRLIWSIVASLCLCPIGASCQVRVRGAGNIYRRRD